MKNIIKRIIVGVIIGLVLMFARKYLFVSAHAEEVVDYDLEVNNVFAFYRNGQFVSLGNSNAGSVGSGLNRIGFYFNALQGAGNHPTKYYVFSGWVHVSWSMGESALSGAYITNGNIDTITGVCTLNHNTSMQDGEGSTYNSTIYAFQVECYVPNGLNYGANSNVLVLQFSNDVSSGTMSAYLDYHSARYSNPYISGLDISGVTGAINSASSSVTNSVNDLNDSINDDSIGTDTDNDISNLQNTDISSTEDAGIQDLITLPIELFNGILSALNGSCSPYRIGSLLGEDITLPCFNLGGVLGSVWNIIDIVISSCIFFKFSTKLKEIFINLTSLNENKGDLIE